MAVKLEKATVGKLKSVSILLQASQGVSQRQVENSLFNITAIIEYAKI